MLITYKTLEHSYFRSGVLKLWISAFYCTLETQSENSCGDSYFGNFLDISPRVLIFFFGSTYSMELKLNLT